MGESKNMNGTRGSNVQEGEVEVTAAFKDEEEDEAEADMMTHTRIKDKTNDR